MRGEIKELPSLKVTACVFALLFSKENFNKANIASTEITDQFLTPNAKVPVLRRNKATNSSTSTHPFSAATKTLKLEIYSNFLDLPSHSHGQFTIGDNEKEKDDCHVFLHLNLSPSGKLPLRMC